MSHLDLTNHFLIATPALEDVFFHKSLVYIFEHSKKGAMGIIINNKLAISYGEIMQQLMIKNISRKLFDKSALSGGPVDVDHGLVIHNAKKDQWQATMDVGTGIKLTSSKDILTDIANDNFEADFLISLGYSGWAAGQLEQELGENTWLSCPANMDIIFKEKREDKLDKACNLIGIKWSSLSSSVGHA